MLKCAFQDVRYDFHVAVRVWRKAAAAGDAVVVHYAQGTKLDVLGIEIIGERKGEMGIQPAVVGASAVAALTNGNHVVPPRLRKSNEKMILVITTIVKRCIQRGPPAGIRSQGRALFL